LEGSTNPEYDLSEIIKRINEITDTEEYSMEFFPGAKDDEIALFERENNVSLPEFVKEWLRFSDGCYLFNIIQLYGVAHRPYIEIKPEAVTGGYICIGALCFGDAVCCIENSPKIIRYGESLDEYADFKEFLEYIIELGATDE